nr:hypothetical protein [Escherichia coli]
MASWQYDAAGNLLGRRAGKGPRQKTAWCRSTG